MSLAVFLIMQPPLAAVAGTTTVPAPCKGGGAPLAMEQAYRDFSASLLRSSGGKPKGALALFLIDIDNYEVRTVLERDKYIVKFFPYAYPGGVIKGAGATYTINRCTFVIEEIKGRQPIE
jgi:hypothetical protein